MTDPHKILSEIFIHATINNHPALLISYKPITNNAQTRLKSLCYIFSMHYSMILTILHECKINKLRYFIVREFSNIALLFFCPLILKHRKKIVFNINHNLKDVSNGFPKSIYLLALLGFNFLMLDGDLICNYIPRKIKNKFIFFPFPTRKRDTPIRLNKRETTKIGIVGDFRDEKAPLGIVSTMIADLTTLPNTNILIGYRTEKVIRQLLLPQCVTVISTESEKEYESFLHQLDILIIFAKRNSYFSRHSGTIIDAASYGVIPVVPSLPVFESQILTPLQIGVTYVDLLEVKDVVAHAIENAQQFKSNLREYINIRSRAIQIYIKDD